MTTTPALGGADGLHAHPETGGASSSKLVASPLEGGPLDAPAGRALSQDRLLPSVRRTIRLRHYSRRTEDAYIGWIRRFVRHHGVRHPREMGTAEVTAFLNSLAVVGGVSAATQNQALAALVFLYREVLGMPIAWPDEIVRAKRERRLPEVLTRDEVRAVLRRLDGVPRLVAELLYGGGLRLLECLTLRVKDLNSAGARS